MKLNSYYLNKKYMYNNTDKVLKWFWIFFERFISMKCHGTIPIDNNFSYILQIATMVKRKKNRFRDTRWVVKPIFT